MLSLSQLGAVVTVAAAVAVAVDEDEFYPFWSALTIIVLDGLVLLGVIGPGLPLSAKTGTELLVADFGACALLGLSVGLVDEEGGMIAGFLAGLLTVGLVEWVLLAGAIWPQQHLTAGPPTPTVTATSRHAPAPTVTVTRTVTARPGRAPAPAITVTRTVTAPPRRAPAPTITVTRTTTATGPSVASGQGQSDSGGGNLTVALATAGGGLLGGLGTFMVGWISVSERRKHPKKTQPPPAQPPP